MILGIAALVFLALKVSGLTSYSYGSSYKITASFQNIGDLKERAPVTVAGVRIGQVTKITLDPVTYEAVVHMRIEDHDQLPVDSTANIYTAGLIGSNYISITPGFSDTFLKNGGKIERTNQAMILQNIIGQLLYSFKNDSSDQESSGSDNSNSTNTSSKVPATAH